MRRFRVGLASAAGGYLLGALVGYFLIATFSGNTHDRSVEAATTAAFVVGPFGGVVAFVVGVVFSGRKSHRMSPGDSSGP